MLWYPNTKENILLKNDRWWEDYSFTCLDPRETLDASSFASVEHQELLA